MKYTSLILSVLFNSVLFGQAAPPLGIKVKDSSFPDFLETRIINSYRPRLENIGELGICWIRFTVSSDNRVSDIRISPNTNPVFTTFLKEVIADTDGQWSFSNQFNLKDDKTIVLPLWYVLQREGKAKKLESNDDQTIALLTDSNKPSNITLFPKLEYISPFYHNYNRKNSTTEH